MTEIPDQSQQPAVPPAAPQSPSMPPPTIIQMPAEKRSRLPIIIVALLLVASVGLNLLLMVALVVGRVSALASSGADQLVETVIDRADVATADKIAVIRVEGMITENGIRGMLGRQATSYLFVRRQLQRAAEDKNVRSVILRVNSPGGGAAASDLIYHELKQFEKPIIVYFGSVAASGGYYVGMAGDKIIAQPTCLTGSVGVIGQLVTVKQMMEEKLGIQVHTLKSGEFKDVGSPFREMTPKEQDYLQNTLIMPIYERFVGVVKAGRPKLSEMQIREHAQGQVFSAQQALDAGLVDQIGYFEDAVKAAKSAAGVSEANVVSYSVNKGLFDVLGLAAEQQSESLLNLSPEMLTAWTTPQVMMLWQGR